MKKSFIIKIILLIFLIVQMIYSSLSVGHYQIIFFLCIVITDIIFEKYFKKTIILILEFLIITYISRNNYNFVYAYFLVIFNSSYSRKYIIAVLSIIAGLIILPQNTYDIYVLISMLMILIGYIMNNSELKEDEYKSSADNERRLRYELEKTKNLLIKSNEEIAYMTQLKERNRISRELHDNIGHSLAGIFMQMQVAYKLYDRNSEKSKETLKSSIDGLSKTIELVRETVHDLKPKENIGIDYIKNIIDNFKFCKVNLKYSGDFNNIPVNHIQIITENLKEALTNIIKYSKATEVKVEIDTNDNYSRLYIKDNGIGSEKAEEGFGIGGMRERVNNAGGNISIDCSDGFLIVCIIPKNRRGGIFESYDS